ncbi:MAG: methytransferase partner Trm112 [Euryarchaeota archaeon]|nr:methytransferase partner Trm112 [Euryarchaeota archaeon]
MKKELIDILCCPTCKNNLTLQTEKEENGEILTGKFTCKKCKVSYPIEDGIPDLLPRT